MCVSEAGVFRTAAAIQSQIGHKHQQAKSCLNQIYRYYRAQSVHIQIALQFWLNSLVKLANTEHRRKITEKQQQQQQQPTKEKTQNEPKIGKKKKRKQQKN